MSRDTIPAPPPENISREQREASLDRALQYLADAERIHLEGAERMRDLRGKLNGYRTEMERVLSHDLGVQ